MHRERVRGRAPGSPSATESATGHAGLAPGKCTLTEGLVVQRRETAPASHEPVHAAAARGTAAPASALPFADRIQRLFGRHDISGIQAHVGSDAAAAAGAMGARAYATGNHVVLGDPGDLFTVAHEAAHVVQQRGGVQLSGGVGTLGDAYEQHADQVAQRVVAGQSAEALLDQVAGSSTSDGSSAVAAPSPAVQRAPDYRTATQIGELRLYEFDRYAHAQADWAISDGLGGKKEALRGLLAFARRNKGMVLAGCRRFKVKWLVARGVGNGGGDDASIVAYSRSASPTHNAGTIHIEEPATQLADVVAWGAAIRKLEAAIDGRILESIVVQRAGMQNLARLVAQDAVDDFIAYVQTHRPTLHATTGREIYSFLEFRNQGGLHKVSESRTQLDEYKDRLPEIRNFHRFTVQQLDRLCQHRDAATRNPQAQSPLPICVVLQTPLDSGGVFYQGPPTENLTPVIMRDTHLVLVAEGKPTLREFLADLKRFATFGKDGQIDEILLTGHGTPTQLKLAGTVGIHTPKGKQQAEYSTERSDSLTSDPKLPRASNNTHGFFRVIASLLRDDPASRLVLNGCLTNASNLPKLTLDPHPDIAATQIVNAMDQHPNLTAQVQQVMGQHQAQVRGANASFSPGLVGLLDRHGRIDLVGNDDLALTAPDKITYVEHGTEPAGVLRALLEAWARNRKAAIEALVRRRENKASDRGWGETVIRAVTTPILYDPANASLIQTMITCASALSHLKIRRLCRVKNLVGKVPDPFLPAIFEQLCQSTLWSDGDYDHVPIVVLQVWLAKDPDKIPVFLEFLNNSAFTTQNAASLIDRLHLGPYVDQLLEPPTPDVKPPDGPLLLALLYLTKQPMAAPGPARQYIATLVGDTCAFPAGCERMLKGVSERHVLKCAGVLMDDEQTGRPLPPNVAPRFGRDNEVRVKSVTKRCTALDEDALIDAYMLPSGARVGELHAPATSPLHVIGGLTWTCPAEPMDMDTGESREPTLRDGRSPDDKVELLAIEWGGPFPTVFIEKRLVKIR